MTTATGACLEARDLSKRYASREVLKGVSLTISSGEIVGLLGPNGAGKTTCFYSIVGLIKPDRGNILLDGELITLLPMHQRARRGLGYLPQEASVFRKLSVRDNILSVLELQQLDKQQQAEQAENLLADFQLQEISDTLGISLSGGERRRLEIARALAAKPRFILLDEPFAGIDPISMADIQSLIRALAQRGIGVLITDHNWRETLSICDRAYIIHTGQVLKQGPPESLLASQQVKKAYLGADSQL